MKRLMGTLLLLIFFITPTIGQEIDLRKSVEIELGISYTLLAPDLEDLEYVGLGPDEERSLWALWPLIAVHSPEFMIGPLPAAVMVGFQPMFISTLTRSQLNPDDTEHKDSDYSLYAMLESRYSLSPALDLNFGAGLRLHYWTYDYYYDSELGPDTSEFDSGTYTSFAGMIGIRYSLTAGKTKVPFYLRLHPVFAYGLMVPVSISTGFTL